VLRILRKWWLRQVDGTRRGDAAEKGVGQGRQALESRAVVEKAPAPVPEFSARAAPLVGAVENACIGRCAEA
jgi:hypothetical protein